MKTSLKSLICLTMIIFFAAACGKDKKKKASCDIYSMNYQQCISGMNPFNQFAGGFNTSYAYQSLQQWANSPEHMNLGLPAIQVTKSVSTITSGCSEKNLFLGLKVNICTFGSTGSGTNENSIVQIPAVSTRIQFPAVAAIVNPVAPMFLVNVVQAGNGFEVTHADSASNKTIKYFIDLNLHGALQPRVKEDSIAQKREVVVYPN